jgi:DNA-binding MarR family transcriptional regulator
VGVRRHGSLRQSTRRFLAALGVLTLERVLAGGSLVLQRAWSEGTSQNEVMTKCCAKEPRHVADLDPEQYRAWIAFMQVSLQLPYEMNRQLVAESELSLSDYHVLSKVHQAPDGRLRMAPLAREIGWERSRTSHQVRRMTERGLIATEQATDDRRGTEVTATARGKAAFSDARRGHVELVRELFFGGLRDDLLTPLAESLEHVYLNIVEHRSAHTALTPEPGR